MTTDRRNNAAARILGDFLSKRAAPLFPPLELERLRAYLLGLLARAERVPAIGRGFDWSRIAAAANVDRDLLIRAKDVLRPGLVVLQREIAKAPATTRPPAMKSHRRANARPATKKPARRTRAPRKAIEPFPEPTEGAWDDPETFHEALALHMRRHRDSCLHLCRAILRDGETLEKSTIIVWRSGRKAPRSVASLEFLQRIEWRYRLPNGYFKAKLPHRARATTGHVLTGISGAEQRRLAWHLPDDFGERPIAEQEEILEWVRRVVISGSTEFRRYQANAVKLRYAVRFATLQSKGPQLAPATDDGAPLDETDPELVNGTVRAPPQLAAEMADLVRFKTSTLTALGYQRRGVWGDGTAAQKVEHLGLMFGALAGSSRGAVRGHDVPLRDLTFGLLVFPAV